MVFELLKLIFGIEFVLKEKKNASTKEKKKREQRR